MNRYVKSVKDSTSYFLLPASADLQSVLITQPCCNSYKTRIFFIKPIHFKINIKGTDYKSAPAVSQI